MRPYLAIITDSFRAAFASRVLWIVLAAILLFLLVIAPFGYREIYTVEFSRGDINSSERITSLLVEGLKSERDRPAKRVAQALPEEFRQRIQQTKPDGSHVPSSQEFVTEFNKLIKTDEWFDAETWKGSLRLSELRELDELDGDSMEDSLRQRRARLRLEAAFPGAFRPRPDRSLKIIYAMLDTPGELPFTRDRFAQLLNTIVLPLIMDLLLGVGAVFVGILVTSPIIPEMFQPGSLHLLLSKPVSRPMLFLSKFVGGCAFVLLCVALLVTGLFVIAGSRFDIWNPRLFYTIPVFVFLFAVYYSVSALAGLYWRSAVVSVVMTILFWFGCFIMGQVAAVTDAVVLVPARVKSITPYGDGAIVSTQAGSLSYLEASGRPYKSLITGRFGPPMQILGPMVLPDGKVVATSKMGQGFNDFGDSNDLSVFDPKDEWKSVPGINLPRGTRAIFATSNDQMLAFTSNGLYVTATDKIVAPEQKGNGNQLQGLLSGLQRFLSKPDETYRTVSPPGVGFVMPAQIESIPDSSDFIVYSAGSIYRLRPTDKADKENPWTLVASTIIDGDSTSPTTIASTSTKLVIARKGEPIRIMDLETLDNATEVPFPENKTINSMVSAAGIDAVYLLASDNEVRKLSLSATPTLENAPFPYQGKIRTMYWAAPDAMWIAYGTDSLAIVAPETGEIKKELQPETDIWRWIADWIVTPARYILPQTGEVGEAVIAIITGRDDLEMVAGGESQQTELDVARPLITCGVFTAAMLLLGCIYVHRQDF